MSHLGLSLTNSHVWQREKSSWNYPIQISLLNGDWCSIQSIFATSLWMILIIHFGSFAQLILDRNGSQNICTLKMKNTCLPRHVGELEAYSAEICFFISILNVTGKRISIRFTMQIVSLRSRNISEHYVGVQNNLLP